MPGRLPVLTFLLIAVTLTACAERSQLTTPPLPANTSNRNDKEIKLTSTAFKEGESLPRPYTCDGVNISPPLEWTGLPATAKTLALVVTDPDAPGGTFVHWVLYNLPADNIGVVENVPATENLKAGGFQGRNDFGKIGYGGPCPPSGTHHYNFRIYALDTELLLKAGATNAELMKAIEGHTLVQGQLTGTYRR